MILLEGFLVRLMVGLTKNLSRRIINVTFLSKRTRLKWREDWKKIWTSTKVTFKNTFCQMLKKIIRFLALYFLKWSPTFDSLALCLFNQFIWACFFFKQKLTYSILISLPWKADNQYYHGAQVSDYFNCLNASALSRSLTCAFFVYV